MKIDLTTAKEFLSSHPQLKQHFTAILNKVKKAEGKSIIKIIYNENESDIKKDFLIEDLTQITEAQTFERAKYYVNRLIKSLTEVKQSKINDLNLNRWKEYDDLITDSLWIFNKRDSSGAHNAGYWGNFIPQIPNQLLRRFTKSGDWVLDPFLGSGTTLIECKRLGRNIVGIDLSDNAIALAEKNSDKESNPYNIVAKTIKADSTSFELKPLMKDLRIRNFHFVLMHPPYWDIIKFSQDNKDLSNAASVNEFLELFGKTLDNLLPHLEKKRYLAIVIGDKYSNGEWIPLGFLTMQEALKRSLKLKSIIVKNFEDTLAKRNQKELWRYRALVGGFYIFKHEYILLMQKK